MREQMTEPGIGADEPDARPPQPDPRVSWAELFFDLVFVFAVTEVSTLLRGDHTPLGVAGALVVFVPIYWAWVGTSIHANTHEVDNPVDRLMIFGIGLCGLFMAMAAPSAYAEAGVLFGGAYFAARVLLAIAVHRGGVIDTVPFRVAVFCTGPLLLLGGFLPNPARLIVWAAGACVDLMTPTLARRVLVGLHFAPAHLAERFGLFLIIALGESVVAIGGPAAAARHVSLATLAAVAVAFVLAAALWWVYFAFASSAMHHALSTSRTQTDIVRRVLSYGHLVFIASIIALAVGVGHVVADPAERLDGGVTALLFGGCALYLAGFGYTRWAMFRLLSVTRLGAAVAVLAALPLSRLMPSIAALGMLAGITVVLNVVEHLRVRRAQGRPGPSRG